MSNFHDRLHNWNDKLVKWATEEMNLKDVGCCYYKMETNDVIPNHSDAYNVYTKKFNCTTVFFLLIALTMKSLDNSLIVSPKIAK